MKLDAYIRVSQVAGRGGENFISPEAQRDVIRGWASANGVEIAQWHTDLDQTGAKLDRPGFNLMMRRIEAGETGGVAVAKIDRFARSLVGAMNAIQRIDSAGGLFVSIQDGADNPSPAGRLHQRMMLSLAEFELDRITENWADARSRAVQRGVFIGAAPFGYDRNHDGRLIPNRAAELVTSLFKLKKKGWNLQEISDWLNERATPCHAAKFMPQTVSKMLKNRAYLGESRHGSFVNQTAHEPLIDLETFLLVQPNTMPRLPRSKKLLAGLLRCSGCRHTLVWKQSTGNPFYRCRKHHGGGDCANPTSIRPELIEPFVVARFIGRAIEIPVTDDTVVQARADLDSATDVFMVFRDDLDLQALLTRSEWMDGLATRKEARDAAERRYAAARASSGGIDLVSAVKTWDELCIDSKREAMAHVIDAVWVRPGDDVEGRTHFSWAGELPSPMPIRGHGGYRTVPFDW